MKKLQFIIFLNFLYLGFHASAQVAGSTDFVDDSILCENCGSAATDWRRYRNTVFNVCIWGPSGAQAPHECRDMVESSVFSNDTDWISVCVEPEIEDVALETSCQRVNIKFAYQAGITLDVPWIETGVTTGQVEEIRVQMTLPNGDAKNDVYAPVQGPLPTAPPNLPYPGGHPLINGSSTGGSTGSGSTGGNNTGGGHCPAPHTMP